MGGEIALDRGVKMDELISYREQFPILKNTLYLINHSLGAMPQKTYNRLHDYADIWANRGIRAWAEGWCAVLVYVGVKSVRLISAGLKTVVIYQNATA